MLKMMLDVLFVINKKCERNDALKSPLLNMIIETEENAVNQQKKSLYG